MDKKIGKKFILIFCFLMCCLFGVSSGYEFVNQEITEILYSISMVENQSIVGDDTVSGTGTFRFYGENFEEAFDSFLLANRLYVDKTKQTWIVSKIKFEKIESEWIFDCYDLYLEKIFEHISEHSDFAIIFSSLPNIKQSFHLRANSVEELVTLILKNYSNYEVKVDGKTILIEKKVVEDKKLQLSNNSEKLFIEKKDEKFNITLKNVYFDNFLENLKTKTDFQFFSLVKENPVIYWVEVENQDFDYVLDSVASLCNVSYVKKDDVYIFYSDYGKSNLLIEKNKWETYKLENILPENFISLFSSRFQNVEIMILSNTEVMINHSKQDEIPIKMFIKKIDVKQEKHLLTFNYISEKDFFDNLPKDYSRENFYPSGTNYSVYFYGTQAQFEELSEYVLEMDKPIKKVSYDLLIVQTQKSLADNWNANLRISQLKPGNIFQAGLSMAPQFSFSLDFVHAFGYKFAAELQTSIQENQTEIFADTTLHGVSDVPIEFRNTSTFRYRDPYINLENGNQIQSGITKEIVSGIVLEIVGSVSGNGTITTSVSASVSRRGADVSSNSGNPPPTSEKFVTTQVIGKSGEVIVLSGLVQNDSTYVEERVPFFGKIPLIGKLFSGKTKSNEKTEMIIYLVPHIEEKIEVAEEIMEENQTFIVGEIFDFHEKMDAVVRTSVIKALSKF